MGNQNNFINHSHFGNIKTVQQKQILLLQMNIYNASMDQLTACIKYRQIIAPEQRQLLLLPFEQISHENCYGQQIKIHFEYYPYTLQDQLNNRKSIKNKFKEQELWYILWHIIKTKAILSKYGLVLGDIQPNNILANNSGQIVCIYQYSYPGFKTNRQKLEQISKFDHKFYVSPEYLYKIKYSKNANQTKKSDLDLGEQFEIGMTMMHLSLGKQLFEIYDLKNYEMNDGKFKKCLIEFEVGQYSHSYKTIILDLLKPKQCRLASKYLFEFLSSYQAKILKMEMIQFNIYKLKNQSLQKPKYNQMQIIENIQPIQATEYKSQEMIQQKSDQENKLLNRLESIESELNRRINVSKTLLEY